MNQLDIVIPVHPKDHRTLGTAIAGAERNIHCIRRIYIVSAEAYESRSPILRWAPEPTRHDFATLAEVRDRWNRENPSLAWRAGWLYQQILSLGAARYIDDLLPTYLQINADTIFLRPVQFYFEGKRFVDTDSPYPEHRPYLEAYRRLTGEEPLRRSFTAHHMLYNQALLEGLFSHIERKHGKAWFTAYLDSIDYREISAINEQDIYGNWVTSHYPETVCQRPLAWRDVRYVPRGLARSRLARRFDFVSAHTYMDQGLLPWILDRSLTKAKSFVRWLVTTDDDRVSD